MAKIIGYILAILGLAIIALSSKIQTLAPIKLSYIILAGIALIVGGIAFLLDFSSSSSKVKQALEEVPIYEGEGKNRKIVGYKKEAKK
jgi:predicted membrane channel-forming protein YqfA (hemolysin III family)